VTPHATLRLQFHKGFTFADAEALVPYFAALGISHVYASPITCARPARCTALQHLWRRWPVALLSTRRP